MIRLTVVLFERSSELDESWLDADSVDLTVFFGRMATWTDGLAGASHSLDESSEEDSLDLEVTLFAKIQIRGVL